MILFFNGTFIPEKNASISINDRGFLFGDGVFTTIRVENGVIHFFSAHQKRLQEHCQALGIIPPEIRQEWIEELLQKNQADKGVWRVKIVITGGDEPSLTLSKRPHGHLLITVQPYQETTGSLHLATSPSPYHSPTAKWKTLSYLDHLYFKEQACQRQVDDLLLTTERGWILETSIANIFWIEGDILYTPDSSLPYLKGISIQMLEQVWKAQGKQVEYVKCLVKEIPKDAFLYCINSMKGVRMVDQIDDLSFSTDPSLVQFWKEIVTNDALQTAKRG